MKALLAGWCLAACATAQATPESVTVPSLDAPGGVPVALPGHWFRSAVADPAPAVLALHGCSGLADSRGRLSARYTDLAARLNALGVHVLIADSLSPRGEKELCTQRTGQRKVTQLQRRRDALGGLMWLQAQPGVDVARLGLLGWSNGGSTVLAATNERHREVAAARVRPTLAVALYPGCDAEQERGYQPTAPLLMLLGDADDWTPAAPCKALAAAAGPAVQFESYAGAFHGFDGTSPVRLRRDVPNGARPGQGVHLGGDPAARAAAVIRLEAFVRDTWALAR